MRTLMMKTGLIALFMLGGVSAAQAQDEDGGQDKYLDSQTAVAKYHEEPMSGVKWHFKGVFGAYDRGALQRGFQVYREVCASCHALKYVAFRHLEDIGYNKAEVKALAAQYTITDGPDDNGEMFERPGKPSDYLPSPYPNDNAAKAANGGALPPNLSLVVKAREGHENYVYSILTGYEAAPADIKVDPGKYYNPHFASLVISMPPPLTDELVTYADGTPATTEQMAHDVVTFLAWAGEPELEHRNRMGIAVMIFLAIFTIVAYFSYRKIWAPVKRGEKHFGN